MIILKFSNCTYYWKILYYSPPQHPFFLADNDKAVPRDRVVLAWALVPAPSHPRSGGSNIKVTRPHLRPSLVSLAWVSRGGWLGAHPGKALVSRMRSRSQFHWCIIGSNVTRVCSTTKTVKDREIASFAPWTWYQPGLPVLFMIVIALGRSFCCNIIEKHVIIGIKECINIACLFCCCFIKYIALHSYPISAMKE